MWDAQAEADRWRRQAANDLESARVALRERFCAQACFIARQAAEKALMAIAYGHGERIGTRPLAGDAHLALFGPRA